MATFGDTREAATYTFSSVIRGHHVYKDFWTPYIHEELTVGTEEENSYDRHAVAILKDGEVVGHMPCTISRFSWFFIQRGGSVRAVVTGRRKKGVGLEVPCIYIYSGSSRIIKKLEKLLNQVEPDWISDPSTS